VLITHISQKKEVPFYLSNSGEHLNMKMKLKKERNAPEFKGNYEVGQ
jgi:hypothetical protein